MSGIEIIVKPTSSAINSDYTAKIKGTEHFAVGDSIHEALHALAFKIEFREDLEPPEPIITVDSELLRLVTHYQEVLRPAAREKEKVKKLIKPTFKGEPLVEVGPWDITGEWKTVKAYPVKEYTYWMWWIKPNVARMGR